MEHDIACIDRLIIIIMTILVCYKVFTVIANHRTLNVHIINNN